MSSRTIETIVRFEHAFTLPGFDAPQQAGEYRVDHDEETIEAHSRLIWLRVASHIHLPGIGMTARAQQMVPITAAELEAALEQDRILS